MRAASSATITFTNGAGNTGELVLGDSHDFTGTIAGFVGADPAAGELYKGAAHFYERFAQDFESGDKEDAAALAKFLALGSSAG